MAKDIATKFCPRCKKVMKVTDFYKSNNLEKYKDGYIDVCKQCFVAHLDNWDPDTYVPLLAEIDVPYIPDEWNSLLAKWGADPSKMTATTIIGKYLAKMKLSQYNKYKFADSDHVNKMRENNLRTTLKASGMTEAQIDETVADSKVAAPPKPIMEAEPIVAPMDEMDKMDFDLTDEDINYLKLKWGPTYKPFEWVQLEKLYQDMMASYDIQTAGHIDTLKMICKTSLKMNQLIDLGDVEGALKMTKAQDTLMKSGKFTAAQNKAENGEYVDSISEIAMLCEKEGFIPRFYDETPNDKVDWIIKDNQSYAKKLITEEMNLGDMLERALKQIEEDKNREEDSDVSDFEEELFADTKDTELSDDDMLAFREYEDELEKKDFKQMVEDYEKEERKWKRIRGEDEDDGTEGNS